MFVLFPHPMAAMFAATDAMGSVGVFFKWAVVSKVTKPIWSNGLNKVMKFCAAAFIASQELPGPY